jgi:hypothetical protein
MLQIEQLDKPFTLEEVRAVILFYLSCWDIISNNVIKLVHAFYHNILDISKINLASICRLPKKQDAQLITQYRPISLINYSFKIIIKIY